MEEDEAEPVLHHIDKFLVLCEETSWIESATETAVKYSFKLAQSLEMLYLKMNSNGTASKFEEQLINWWNKKNRHVPFTFSFFEGASDKLLISFLSKVNADTNIIFTAIDTYIDYCGMIRFETTVQTLLSERVCERTVMHLLSLKNCDAYVLKDFEFILMSMWTNNLLHGKTERVAQSASKLISDEIYVPCLFKLLTLKEKDESNANVKKIILERILLTLRQGSGPELVLWKKVFTAVDERTVVLVSESYPEFLSTFLEFVTDVGKNMRWEVPYFLKHGIVKWASSDSKASLSDEEFNMVVKILKSLSSSEIIGYRIFAWLDDLVCKSDFPWRDVRCMCVSKN
ncbi:uncharacterized protein LOC126475286 isoform X1 [Schistocerca serialis cubense]|uniref:uncharacterized protein LOC126475286 isoform X1 n=1 Tax=Schistocerca serialis cubense TaxID=2023355 RepID=UPI00214EC6BB|nr:uncharacterized protein LOC126475286 isoform X1 [Schistocerca serialis cubense]